MRCFVLFFLTPSLRSFPVFKLKLGLTRALTECWTSNQGICVLIWELKGTGGDWNQLFSCDGEKNQTKKRSTAIKSLLKDAGTSVHLSGTGVEARSWMRFVYQSFKGTKNRKEKKQSGDELGARR